MATREVEIHRGVREVGVAEEQLNGPQIRPGLEQVRGVGVPQRVRGDALVDAGLLRRPADGVPDGFCRDRPIGTSAVLRTREEIRLRPHPTVVLA